MCRSLITLWLLSFLPLPALAGAWTLEEGQWQLINQGSYYTTNRYVDKDGYAYGGFRYQKLEDIFYVEYGLAPDVTLGLNTSVQQVKQDIPGIEFYTWGLADTEFFVRKRLFFDGENVVSIQPLIKIPGPYDTDDYPPLGQGQVDAELRALYGHSFSWGYLDLQAAYRHRFDDPGDEIRFGSTVGIDLTERWQILLETQGIFAVEGAGTSLDISNTADYDLIKFQVSDIYWFTPRIALQLGLFHNMYTRNTGAGGGVMLGIWYKF